MHTQIGTRRKCPRKCPRGGDLVLGYFLRGGGGGGGGICPGSVHPVHPVTQGLVKLHRPACSADLAFSRLWA